MPFAPNRLATLHQLYVLTVRQCAHVVLAEATQSGLIGVLRDN